MNTKFQISNCFQYWFNFFFIRICIWFQCKLKKTNFIENIEKIINKFVMHLEFHWILVSMNFNPFTLKTKYTFVETLKIKKNFSLNWFVNSILYFFVFYVFSESVRRKLWAKYFSSFCSKFLLFNSLVILFSPFLTISKPSEKRLKI